MQLKAKVEHKKSNDVGLHTHCFSCQLESCATSIETLHESRNCGRQLTGMVDLNWITPWGPDSLTLTTRWRIWQQQQQCNVQRKIHRLPTQTDYLLRERCSVTSISNQMWRWTWRECVMHSARYKFNSNHRQQFVIVVLNIVTHTFTVCMKKTSYHSHSPEASFA